MQYIVKNTITNKIEKVEIPEDFYNELILEGLLYKEYIKATQEEVENFNLQNEIKELKNIKIEELEKAYKLSQICLLQDGLDLNNNQIIFPIYLRDGDVKYSYIYKINEEEKKLEVDAILGLMQKQYGLAKKEGASLIRFPATNGNTYVGFLTPEEWDLFDLELNNISIKNNQVKNYLLSLIAKADNIETLNSIPINLLNSTTVNISERISRNDGNIFYEMKDYQIVQEQMLLEQNIYKTSHIGHIEFHIQRNPRHLYNYINAEGQELEIEKYKALFEILGIESKTSETHFKVPNLKTTARYGYIRYKY